jgi:diguanylate cyclase (GGDEF)-like protein/PAS domain S-box-containing protein
MTPPDDGRTGERLLSSEPPVGARMTRRGINPTRLAYLLGPVALAIILLLTHYGLVSRQPIWVWVVVFAVIPAGSLLTDHVYDLHPDRLTLNIRIAYQVATVTTVIFLSGWGAVLWGCYAFIAMENVSRGGSSAWRTTTIWSLVGMAVGQFGISQGWFPSELTRSQSLPLTVLGAVVLVFVIRMAGATMEQKEALMAQKEEAEVAVRDSEDRFRSLIQNSSDVTMILGTSGTFRYVSPAIRELLGYEPDELIGLIATDFIAPEDHDRVRQKLGAEFQTQAGTTALEFRMVRNDGSECDVEAVVSNQMARPSVAGYVANVRDVTDRKRFEALLAHRALHDPLTGLPNRQLILDRADQMLVKSRRTGEPVAAYFIDLDNFKDANDSLGHAAGDHLLQAVAGRLHGLLRASDTVGRLGGDEFVILAEGMSLSAGPDAIADRIRAVLKPAFSVQGHEETPVTISASVGIACGVRSTAEDLLRDADIALYRAKGAGRDQSVTFETTMQSIAGERLTLRTELDSALERDEYFLVYQPIFDLVDLRMLGVEALIRWAHPSKGMIVPDAFIPALEENGRIVDVGRWVLGEACRQAALWKAEGHDLSMAVNISMRQLESAGLVDDVKEAIEASGVDPSTLVLEVTESVLMKDANATVARLHHLKRLGVQIAIDDFGTGYSSLAHLRQFPVDILKIDRSFVSDMSRSPDAEAFIHTLVELGHTLGLVTLAEGIEEKIELDGLRTEQCDQGQGYYYSRPIAPSQIEELLVREAVENAPT